MTTIKLKNGSGAPDAADLVQGEVALDLTNKRIYSENASGTVIEMGTSPSTIDINAGTIDGTVIGGASAAAITGTTITGTSFVSSGDMTFGDDDKAIFGAGSDLQIFHTGTASVIADTGVGNLVLRADGFYVNNAAGTENMIQAAQDGAVTLYHNHIAKLATTATGIDVTGTVTADGLEVENSSLDVVFKDSQAHTTTDGPRLQFQGRGPNATNYNFGYIQGLSNGSNNAGDIVIGTNTGGVQYQRLRIEDNGDISFYEDTGTTPKFFWDASAESLGIGTSSPVTALTLGTGTTGVCFRSNLATLNSGKIAVLKPVEAGTGNGHLVFETYEGGSGGGERMRITSAGNVGIGTASPRGKVEIVGPASETSTLANAVTNAGLLIKPYSSSDWGLAFGSLTGQVQSIQGVDLGGSSSRSIAINALGGNVGIGTSSPSQKLDVAGGIVATNTRGMAGYIAGFDTTTSIAASGSKTFTWAPTGTFNIPGADNRGAYLIELDLIGYLAGIDETVFIRAHIYAGTLGATIHDASSTIVYSYGDSTRKGSITAATPTNPGSSAISVVISNADDSAFDCTVTWRTIMTTTGKLSLSIT